MRQEVHLPRNVTKHKKFVQEETADSTKKTEQKPIAEEGEEQMEGEEDCSQI